MRRSAISAPLLVPLHMRFAQLTHKCQMCLDAAILTLSIFKNTDLP
jgi:hypothetical protein